jgi:hypothetical protein
MLQIDSYLLASYCAFIILSDIDEEIHESEIQVIDKFIDQFQTSKYFDKDEEFAVLMTYSREARKSMFKEYVEYISVNANSSFKNKFYSFSIELISADKIVKDSELELFFILRDTLEILDNKFIFTAPKQIDKLVKEAIDHSFNINQSIKYSQTCYANVEMKFDSKDGILIQRISFDDSKLNYQSASGKVKNKMDKMRYLARAISLDMIKSGVLGNKKEILNCRYTFKNDDINYFVIADFYRNKVILSYVGCEEWDYHIL